MHDGTQAHFCASVHDWMDMGHLKDLTFREAMTTQTDLVIRMHAACISVDTELVTAAATAGYQNLIEFKCSVLVSARDTGRSIFKVALKFGFLHTTISRVYREYPESGKISNLRHRCGRKKIMQERDQRRLTRCLKRDRYATLLKIAADFNVESSTGAIARTIQRNIIDMGFRSRRPTPVPLLTARHKDLRLTWARQHRHCTVDDWKHVTWSDESLFQLNLADGYGDNLMNPWTVHVSKRLFKLVEALCWYGTCAVGVIKSRYDSPRWPEKSHKDLWRSSPKDPFPVRELVTLQRLGSFTWESIRDQTHRRL
ncbi:HTH_Tnp_Tc3_2 domain-containing protein [Trichonephila clavipes]|nr:HTH_Tnp_Tc3_2 domain-containing protein [Trichonephila clavipes]